MIKNIENVECEFNNNILKFQEDDGSLNKIDLNNDRYIRETKDFLFQIDFKNNECFYKLKEIDNCFSTKINSKMTKVQDKIIMNYSLDGEEKQIIIQML